MHPLAIFGIVLLSIAIAMIQSANNPEWVRAKWAMLCAWATDRNNPYPAFLLCLFVFVAINLLSTLF